MLLKKTTTGFVIQTYDADKGALLDQEFVAGDQCDYEVNGEAVDGPVPFFSKDDDPQRVSQIAKTGFRKFSRFRPPRLIVR